MLLIEIYESITRRVPWSKLPDTVRTDIVENLFRASEWLDATFRPSEFQVELDGSTDEPMLIVDEGDVDTLYKQMKTTHEQYPEQVDNLLRILQDNGDLDPIIVNRGKFFDGGHRLAAYKKLGRKTIPTIDIGQLLDIDWEKWYNGEVDIN